MDYRSLNRVVGAALGYININELTEEEIVDLVHIDIGLFNEAETKYNAAKRLSKSKAEEIFSEVDDYAQCGIIMSLKNDEALDLYEDNIEAVHGNIVAEALTDVITTKKATRRLAKLLNMHMFNGFDHAIPEIQYFLEFKGYECDEDGFYRCCHTTDLVFPNTDPRGLSGGASQKRLQFGDEA